MTALVLFVLLNIFVCIIYKSPIMQSITNIVILLFIFVVVVIISIELVIRVPLVFQHFTSYIRNSIIKQGGNEIEYQYMLGILTSWVLMVVYILCTMNQTFARFYKFLQAYVTSLILVYVYILLPSSIALFVIRFFEIVNPKNSDNINIFYITLAMLIVIPFSIIEAESRIKRCMQSFDRKWIYYKASNQLLWIIAYMCFTITVVILTKDHFEYIKDIIKMDKNSIVDDIAIFQIQILLPTSIIFLIYLLGEEYNIDKKCKEIYG